MTNNNYELDILINGKPAKEYIKDGKIYIEGRKGTDFSLRIRNNSSKRILAIPSVDGLSVMNGKNASFQSSGYILDGYESITIDGWRTSDKEVARFYFSKAGESYAADMDRDGNIGVIGMAVFEEKRDELEELKKAMEELAKQNNKQQTIYHYHYPHCHCWTCTSGGGGGAGTFFYSSSGSAGASGNITVSGSAGPTATANATNYLSSVTPTASMNVERSMVKSVKQDLGTGWGESKRSEVRTVEFERADAPSAVFEIFYNTREQLENLGIDFNARPIYVAPQAFPGVYCEPPRK